MGEVGFGELPECGHERGGVGRRRVVTCLGDDGDEVGVDNIVEGVDVDEVSGFGVWGSGAGEGDFVETGEA